MLKAKVLIVEPAPILDFGLKARFEQWGFEPPELVFTVQSASAHRWGNGSRLPGYCSTVAGGHPGNTPVVALSYRMAYPSAEGAVAVVYPLRPTKWSSSPSRQAIR